MSFKSSYAAYSSGFSGKAQYPLRRKQLLLTGAVAWTPMLRTDDMLQKKGFL